jgi:hypothetical protein
VLHDTWLERFARDKHSNLLDPFLSYEENEGLLIQTLEPYSQHFIFFLTYEYFQQARVLDYTRPEKLTSDKHSNLLRPFVSNKES